MAPAESVDPRCPVLVVTGFLGSGKTTLLRDALKQPAFRRSLLLVNEVAATGVDDRLLRTVAGHEVRLLGNGCLCCTVQEDLRRTLLDIVDDPSVMRDIDRVVVETSGLADPVSTVATLGAHPRLSRELRLQAVVAVVDAQNAQDQAREFAEFSLQVQCADALVLAKTDLVTTQIVAEVEQWLNEMNPVAERLDVSSGACRALAALHGRLVSRRFLRPWLSDAALPSDGGLQRGVTAWQHAGGERHTRGVCAFAVTIDGPIDWVRFATWFSLMIHANGARLLRVKGLLAVDADAPPVVIHSVRHVVHFPEHLAAWPDDDRTSQLVFVVRDLDPSIVVRSLRAFVGAQVERLDPPRRRPLAEPARESADVRR